MSTAFSSQQPRTNQRIVRGKDFPACAHWAPPHDVSAPTASPARPPVVVAGAMGGACPFLPEPRFAPQTAVEHRTDGRKYSEGDTATGRGERVECGRPLTFFPLRWTDHGGCNGVDRQAGRLQPRFLIPCLNVRTLTSSPTNLHIIQDGDLNFDSKGAASFSKLVC